MISVCYAIRIGDTNYTNWFDCISPTSYLVEDFESVGFTGLNLTLYLTTINSVQSYEGMSTNMTNLVMLVECLNVDSLRENLRVVGLKGSRIQLAIAGSKQSIVREQG